MPEEELPESKLGDNMCAEFIDKLKSVILEGELLQLNSYSAKYAEFFDRLKAAVSEGEMAELSLYKKMYATLVSGMVDITKYIQCEMMIHQAYDWEHTREIYCKIVDSLQAAEAIYVERPEDEK